MSKERGLIVMLATAEAESSARKSPLSHISHCPDKQEIPYQLTKYAALRYPDTEATALEE